MPSFFHLYFVCKNKISTLFWSKNSFKENWHWRSNKPFTFKVQVLIEFTLINCCTFYFITSTVKVILKPYFFSLNSCQTFFLHVIFSGHLKVFFVHLFTGVVYPKSIIVSRAFKCRLFLTCTLYLSYDIFHGNFLRTFKCLLFFTYILSSNITYHYVFVYTT
jgi:CBS domain containing-hemolysin-like protein